MTPLLAGHGLSLLRGDRLLFRQLDFALEAGQGLLVEGDNGTGKTSLLRVIAGLLPADEGYITWRGARRREARQAFRAELVWYGHRPGAKLDLNVRENLRCEAALRPAGVRAVDEVLEELGLAHIADLPLRVLSAGQQRRAALARLGLSGATLWLLDEPYTNLDRAGRGVVDALVTRHLDAGGCCVLASHAEPGISRPLTRLGLG